ncbi:Uma2 family endonuclease [Pseudanabaena sp. FACHB-1998]|uniref:Uma2 family endonuclease n=1 Tax=Pseudanabaena sp. FACHB-1998 TaxID=2692858 RepID=UPI0016816375|nr:Uma2 family endonuclease [Pseudanabaena sp. FACHB-1998]MBD2179137.1 Uma2 family endonuclease [Pseudanabaena sp. FACHB-1998]
MVLLNVNPPSVSENLVSEVTEDLDEDLIDEIKIPPTNLYSDEPQLETDFHREQIDLLIRLLKYFWRDRYDFYISGNLTVYYNQKQLKSRDFAGPDIFVVLGTEKRDRRSWVVWDEDGKYPNVVIELLSNSTAKVDRGAKKQLYQDVWRVPNYFWFHPETLEFAGFHLVDGKYEALIPNAQGYLWIEQLGIYLGIHENQLRYFTPDGAIVPLPEEQERIAKEQVMQRAERLEAILRSQGIDPDQ